MVVAVQRFALQEHPTDSQMNPAWSPEHRLGPFQATGLRISAPQRTEVKAREASVHAL